jgi:MinD superfamily P-loop ATPase
LIEAVKDVPGNEPWIILDAPPGTTCPVTATLRGVDFVLLVTEPTPFGQHDLELALALARQMDIPCGVVINRAGATPGLVEDFCSREDVPLLARIPFRREVAACCAEGGLAIDADSEVAAVFDRLLRSLEYLEVAT